jgi:hypothetical protein
MLFSEVNHFVYDSRSEAKDNRNGISPMNQDYTDRVNQNALN